MSLSENAAKLKAVVMDIGAHNKVCNTCNQISISVRNGKRPANDPCEIGWGLAEKLAILAGVDPDTLVPLKPKR